MIIKCPCQFIFCSSFLGQYVSPDKTMNYNLSLSVIVRTSLEPGWLEGTLNGKTGLVPENYVELLPWCASLATPSVLDSLFTPLCLYTKSATDPMKESAGVLSDVTNYLIILCSLWRLQLPPLLWSTCFKF